MAVETLAKIPGRQMLEVRRLDENAWFFASRPSEVVTNAWQPKVVADDGVDLLQAESLQKPGDPNLCISSTILMKYC